MPHLKAQTFAPPKDTWEKTVGFLKREIPGTMAFSGHHPSLTMGHILFLPAKGQDLVCRKDLHKHIQYSVSNFSV